MTDNSPSSPAAAPGWYPTAPGSPTYRWWDGRQWTDQLQNLSQLTPQPLSTVTTSTPVYNVFIWLFTLLPLVNLLALLPVDLTRMMTDSVRQSLATPRGSTPTTVIMMSDPGYLLVQVLGWVVLAAGVVLAYFDWRRLGRLGFARRFHWAWAFLGLVYMIGRTVVVRREAGRGMAVLWVYIGIGVLSLIVALAKVSAGVSAMVEIMQQYR